MSEKMICHRLVIVLGDQLNADSAVFDEFDKANDVLWMAEVEGEAKHVWSHKARIALFLAAMRHYRDARVGDGYTVDYQSLDKPTKPSLGEELADAIRRHRPREVVMVKAGEYRVQQAIEKAAEASNVPLVVLADRHFYSTPDEFAAHAEGRKQLRLEFFYRELRKKHRVLLDDDGEPVGGSWNYDSDNRGSFGKPGPSDVPSVPSFRSHGPTQEVLKLVNDRYRFHPGTLEHFNWPTTASQAKRALEKFVEHRLPHFGQYQDALWTGEPFLYHSLISSSLNLKLLNPRQVVAAAEEAYHAGHAPLASVEGFVRQILGWREYVRGIYWHFMPEYVERNALRVTAPLPDFYWTGGTDMHCLQQAIGQTLEYGYAHHIQRLMVTGLFAMLLGVDPKQVHEWYLAVYVDAVEWVELPNTLGMSQYADGGVMASKPYCASGNYIHRMSNYCTGCRYNPAKATGEDACPFTTLYWDFLDRNKQRLKGNNRMAMQLKNLERKSESELVEIREQAQQLKRRFA
jgi:deoxyribodipyrimidine photolyase-related protein